MHIRDHLFPRFTIKVDNSSDLCDYTLSAASELMLAQAAECYYFKAEYGMCVRAGVGGVAFPVWRSLCGVGCSWLITSYTVPRRVSRPPPSGPPPLYTLT